MTPAFARPRGRAPRDGSASVSRSCRSAPRSGSLEPRDRSGFVAGLAAGINELVRDPDRAAEMGRAGRARAVEQFAWPAIAEQTSALYRSL